jgi:hypothetical protein
MRDAWRILFSEDEPQMRRFLRTSLGTTAHTLSLWSAVTPYRNFGWTKRVVRLADGWGGPYQGESILGRGRADHGWTPRVRSKSERARILRAPGCPLLRQSAPPASLPRA